MARTLTRDRAQALLDAAEVAWWLWGDLGLSVRRVLAAGREVSEHTLTSQTVYTYFGSMDAMIAAMAERAVTRAHRHPTMAHPDRAPHGGLRLHRRLVQHPPPPLHPRLPTPSRIRKHPRQHHPQSSIINTHNLSAKAEQAHFWFLTGGP